MGPAKPLIEVCVYSVESALAAEAGGALRVELCDNMAEGGTTPSAGAIAAARARLRIPLQVMIRPRGGDFCYSDVEFDVMKRDIALAKQCGADGIVIGLLLPDGTIDVERTRALVALARPMSVTCHRAFDMTRDAFEALESLIEAGVDRILTSGQQPSIVEGLDLITELVRRADRRIAIMACGGVNERNAARIVAESRVRELHLSAFMNRDSEMKFRNERVSMGGTTRPSEYSYPVTDPARIAALVAALPATE